jgi:hypothetical protein
MHVTPMNSPDSPLPMSEAAPSASEADPWVDPAADEVGQRIEAHYRSLRNSSPQECGKRRFALPGCDLSVHFAGRSVADALTAAFDHLATDEPSHSGLQLEWQIGDSALAGGFPVLPPPPRPLHPLGSLHRNETNSVLVDRRHGFATVLDAASMRLTTIADGLDSIDTDLAAKPLLRFLLSLLLRQDIVLCHAALIGGPERGLLVTGQGGIGKSTITAAALVAGAGFCSDDFVALEWRNGELIGHCLFATLMLTKEQMLRFPALEAHATQLRADTFGKYLVPLAPHFGGQIRRSLRIDAVAVPQIVATAPSSLVPGRRSAMLRAITPSTLVASPWREAERTRFLFDHVASLEPLIYQSGSDFFAIAEPLRARYGF